MKKYWNLQIWKLLGKFSNRKFPVYKIIALYTFRITAFCMKFDRIQLKIKGIDP